MQQFPNEREAVAFVEKCLWGDKPICPHCCGKETTPRLSRHRHNCKKCRKDFTGRNGIVFDNSWLLVKNGYMRFTCYKLRVKALAVCNYQNLHGGTTPQKMISFCCGNKYIIPSFLSAYYFMDYPRRHLSDIFSLLKSCIL